MRLFFIFLLFFNFFTEAIELEDHDFNIKSQRSPGDCSMKSIDNEMETTPQNLTVQNLLSET